MYIYIYKSSVSALISLEIDPFMYFDCGICVVCVMNRCRVYVA